MTDLIPIALLGWVPLTVALFALLPGWKAALVSALVGWLFLPCGSLEIPGFPDFTKETSISLGLVLGMLCFDFRSLRALRPSLWDLPVVVWCLSGSFSALANHTGPYDATSAAVMRFLIWGAPYLAGRLYLGSMLGLRRVVVATTIAGAVYAPLCLWEVRMSPQLHHMVYGVAQHFFLQTIRGSTYRPMVFTHHGLELTMWLAGAALCALAIARSRRRRSIAGVDATWYFGLITLALLASRSFGATALFLAGAVIVIALPARAARMAWIGLIGAVVVYVGVRAMGVWSAESLVEFTASISPERAESLAFRLSSEDLLLAKAQSKWLFGWSPWYFQYVLDAEGHVQKVVTDSMWLIAFATNGAVGLVSFFAMLLVPSLGAYRMLPRVAGHPYRLCLAALGVIFALHAIDYAANGFVFTPLCVAVGGVSGLLVSGRRAYASEPVRAAPTARARDVLVGRGEWAGGRFALRRRQARDQLRTRWNDG